MMKECNIHRHYETKHDNDCGTLTGDHRRQKVEELKINLSKEQNVFKKVLTQSQSAVHDSYAISHVIAKAMRPFSEEFVKNCRLQASDILCPEKGNALLT